MQKKNFYDVFSQIDARYRESTQITIKNSNGISYSVWVSFAEIYNDFVYDLLQPLPNRTRKRTCLKLGEDGAGNVFVKGLQRISVSSANEAMKLLVVGQKNLRFAVTKLNQNSSRSHCIFTIELVRTADATNPKIATVSKLSFCDLAGSERYSKTRSTGDRLKEACNINSSLLVLARCISTLKSNQSLTKESLKLIPFRESKLTRLFQNFFTRKGSISMIVNISPEPNMCDETIHVLKFSALAEKVLIIPQREKKHLPSKTSLLMLNACQRASVPWIATSDDESGDDADREELFEYIDQLQREIKQLRQENSTIEAAIREEVAAAATAAIIENEKYYSERLQEQKESVEKCAEQRIALILEQNSKSARKRPKCETDDDADMVPLKDHEELKAKLKQVTLDFEDAENEVKMIKDELRVLRKNNSRLSVQQAQYRRESSRKMIESSMRSSNVDCSWMTLPSDDEQSPAALNIKETAEKKLSSLERKLVAVEAKHQQAIAESQAKDDKIVQLLQLVQFYEQSLATKDDKRKKMQKKLTEDNAVLKEQLKYQKERRMKELKENVVEESFENDLADTSNSLIEGTPTKADSHSTPVTVKKLYKPAASNFLLTSPADEKDQKIDVHARVLEQLQLN